MTTNKKKIHKHSWKRTTRMMKRTDQSSWIERIFDPYYKANIAECKCGEWYYLTTPDTKHGNK